MIKAPKWCSHAIPTPRGWADPHTGELYVSKRLGEVEIDEFLNVKAYGAEVVPEVVTPEVVTEEVVHEEPQMLHEAPVNHTSLEDMTKTELVALAEQLGIDFKKSDTKKVLVEKLS